jgi:hypothetical protein
MNTQVAIIDHQCLSSHFRKINGGAKNFKMNEQIINKYLILYTCVIYREINLKYMY